MLNDERTSVAHRPIHLGLALLVESSTIQTVGGFCRDGLGACRLETVGRSLEHSDR